MVVVVVWYKKKDIQRQRVAGSPTVCSATGWLMYFSSFRYGFTELPVVVSKLDDIEIITCISSFSKNKKVCSQCFGTPDVFYFFFFLVPACPRTNQLLNMWKMILTMLTLIVIIHFICTSLLRIVKDTVQKNNTKTHQTSKRSSRGTSHPSVLNMDRLVQWQMCLGGMFESVRGSNVIPGHLLGSAWHR